MHAYSPRLGLLGGGGGGVGGTERPGLSCFGVGWGDGAGVGRGDGVGVLAIFISKVRSELRYLEQ